MIARRVLGALLLGWIGAAAGCSLLHGDYPDRQCEANADCFQAQGESCERDAGVCRLAADAADAAALPDAAIVPDAAPSIDAAVNAGPDAGPGADAATIEGRGTP